MTEANFEAPKSRKCNFGAEDDRHYDTKEEALAALEAKDAAESFESPGKAKRTFRSENDPHPVEEIYITDFAEQHPNEVDESIIPVKTTKEVVVKIGKLHAIFWMLIVISGIVWSFMLAAYLFTGFGSQAVSLMGVLGTLALAATVFSLSKDNVAIQTVEVDPDDSEKESLS